MNLGGDIGAGEPPDSIKDEWAECRSTIGRLDNVLADIRKYGFSLMTLLLTASALITTANRVADRVAASSVVTILVLVLFLMDRYWWVLLREAVQRATELEFKLGMEVSERLARIALLSHNAFAATAVYVIFILLSCGVALVTVVSSGPGWALWSLIIVTGIALGIIFVLHVSFDLLLPPGFQRSFFAGKWRDWRVKHPHKAGVK